MSAKQKSDDRSQILDKRTADPRVALKAIVEASPYSYAALSRMIRRYDGYLSAFVREGRPRCLTESEHRQLADFFGLDERALGVRTLWARYDQGFD